MVAIETVQDDSLHPDPAKSVALADGCKERGLLVGKGGLYGNVVRIAPMLNVSGAEIGRRGRHHRCETVADIG